MVSQPGWAEVFRPWLESKINNSWIDPRDPSFKSQEDFIRAYNTAWSFARAAEDILAYTDKLIEEAEGITKKEKLLSEMEKGGESK